MDIGQIRTDFEKWSNQEYCLEAVKQNGDSLQYVKEQTEAVCLEAVKQNGDSLQYVNKKALLEKCIASIEPETTKKE